MKILVKLGGTLLDQPESRQRLAREIAACAREHQVVVVHGGGKQMTRFLEERGVPSRFVNGLRVSTPEVIDAVLKVFAGSVNKQLVSAFIQAGVRAVGLTGIDACLTEAVQMDPTLGAVGRPVGGDGALLDLLVAHGYLPVVACVAGDRQGNVYNVNADQMAVACAAAFQAEELLFLTDVAGVLGATQAMIPSLSGRDCDELIRSGVAHGGMRAKLEAARSALEQGVGEVVIAPGAEPGVIARLLARDSLGSRIHL